MLHGAGMQSTTEPGHSPSAAERTIGYRQRAKVSFDTPDRADPIPEQVRIAAVIESGTAGLG